MVMSASERLFQIEVLDFAHRGHTVAGTDNGMGMKAVDRWIAAPRRTLFKRAKTAKVAKNWASRFGSVIECRKVDFEPYNRGIEFLKLEQPTIEMAVEDFTVNRAMQLAREPQKKIRIQVVDETKS
jgi:hypothetical protein